MRIGYDAKRYFFNQSGLGNYSRDLIRIIESYYPEIECIRYSPKTPDFSTFNIPSLAEKTKVPNSLINKILKDIWRYKWITKDLIKDKIEIFHGLSGEIPTGLDKTHIKSVVTIHDLIFLRYPFLYNRVDRILYDQKYRYAAKNADIVVAISEQTKKDLVSFYNIPEEKIQVIYQGCDPVFKSPKTEIQKETIRQKYRLPQEFILNVGTIEPRKNALQIVKAIKDLEIPLIIIGKKTSYTDEIERYIHAHNLQQKVIILQGVSTEDLSTIYKMSSLFVYPSQFEGFGIPIIEALYSGNPVITTKSGVFPEAAGPDSFYIDPQNIDELKHGISTVLSDETLRNNMINKGKQYVTRFDDNILAKQWHALYQQLGR